MVLHLLKQQVVVAAAYRDLEHPIGVALDGTDTCAVQAKTAQHDTRLARRRDRSHNANRCPRTCRVARLDEARRLSPEWGGAAVVQRAELCVVLRRLRDLDMCDAANRTVHDAIAGTQVQLQLQPQSRCSGVRFQVSLALTRRRRPSALLEQSKRLGHEHAERDQRVHNSQSHWRQSSLVRPARCRRLCRGRRPGHAE